MSPRIRGILRVVGVAVVVVLVAFGADALARRGATTLLERDITQFTGAAEAPEVRIGGAFLLPQVIRGAYTEVDVDVAGLRSGPLRIESVNARLRDVRVPFHDVLVRDVRSVGIGHSEESVRLLYTDLNTYLENAGRPFRIGPAAQSDQATLTGEADVLGRRLSVSAVVAVQTSATTLSLRPVRIDSQPAELGSTAQLLLSQRLTFTVPLTLPFGQQLSSVSADEQGLTIRAEGTGVVLNP